MVSENVSFEGAYALKLKKLHFSNEKNGLWMWKPLTF